MRQLIRDLGERFLATTGMTLEEFVWTALAICFAFSTAHLVTMLITRWGDRRATGKALLFSLSLHLACLMGACGMQLRPAPSLEAGEQTSIPVRKLVLDDVDQPLVRDTGNTPIWDRLPPPLEPEVERTERAPLDMPTPQTPDRRDVPMPRAETPLTEQTASPERPEASPKPAELAEASPRTVPVESAPIEPGPKAEARPEATLPAAPISREKPVRDPGGAPSVTRSAAPGAAERIDTKVDLDRALASISGPAKPDAAVPRPSQPDESLLRRTGPRPTDNPLDDPGASSAAESPAAGKSPEPSSGDIRSRSPRSGTDTGLESFRPERTPIAAIGAGDRALAIRDRQPIESSRGGPPSLVDPDASPLAARGAGVPPTYRLRGLARRREVSRKYGGTDASERAVEASLKWFASIQLPDGSWDGDRFGAGQVKVDEQGIDRDYAGKESDSGQTALVILAFLGAGYTHEEGQYAETVDKAVGWLIANQRDDGYLGAHAPHYSQMYCHGMATYALAEAWGMQNDPAGNAALRAAVEKGVAYIVSQQNPSDGGWRYVKGQKGDMSMFGWQLMALKSAEIAGLRIPIDTRNRMIAFLKERSRGDANGLAGYRAESQPSPSMTAEALFCKQMLGLSPTNPQCREAIGYLLARLPKRSEYDEYYWYYGTLAMYQYGGEAWTRWNDSLRDLLIAEQVTTGDLAGSWDPKGTWGRYGGRIYQTALSTLCLEVYYRFLPLHQLNEVGP